VIKGINIMTKKKERKLFKLDKIEDLDNFKFSDFIPNNANGVEIKCRDNKGTIILEIDYILSLVFKNIEGDDVKWKKR